MPRWPKGNNGEGAPAAPEKGPTAVQEKPRVAPRTDILSGKRDIKKIMLPPAKPADPIEHFRNTVCERCQKSEWDPQSLTYSIDHRSFLIRCMPCEEYCVIPAGSPKAMEVPAGTVPPR